MTNRVILCIFVLFSFTDARVDFNYSKIYDEYDFWGKSSVTVDGLCRDTCHIFASITEDSRTVASNILIQTAKGFTSIASLADQRNSKNGQKISLEISNTPTLTVVNGNAKLAAGPLVLYIVNKQAPNFADAEVYEADGFLRPPALAHAITVMSARPFTLKQAKEASGAQQGVISLLTGFDAYGADPCPSLYKLSYAPFPGFTLEINAPIVSLHYDASPFQGPAGELSATIGISNLLQLEHAGFFNSPGFHGCTRKLAYKSSLYNYLAPSRVDVANATPQNIVLDIIAYTDEKHPVTIVDSPMGTINKVTGTSAMAPQTQTFKFWAENLIVTWEQDGIVDYHYVARYNSTMN